ncbi:MAG TPA: hypothetical protein VIO60_02990, partial [Rectinemataceae bacterium]
QALLELRDSVYQNLPISSVSALASQARALLLGPEGAPLSPAAPSLASSRIDYLEGRAFNESGDKKAAIALFESSLQKARFAQARAQTQTERNAALLAQAQALSQLCSLKDVFFLVANGPKVLQLAQNILDTEHSASGAGSKPGTAANTTSASSPSAFGAGLIFAQSKAFAPSIFGGDPAKALAMLDELSVAYGENLDKDELFDLNVCRGEALDKLGRTADAAAAFRSALDLYPGNLYAAGRLRGIAP